MATSYNIIKQKFESKFMSRTILDADLVKEYFDNALGEYELELDSLTYDVTGESIAEDLNRTHILLLATLMYKSYLSQQLDKYMKIQSMVGENLSVTGLGDTKKTMESRYESISKEISTLFSKIKDNSYLD